MGAEGVSILTSEVIPMANQEPIRLSVSRRQKPKLRPEYLALFLLQGGMFISTMAMVLAWSSRLSVSNMRNVAMDCLGVIVLGLMFLSVIRNGVLPQRYEYLLLIMLTDSVYLQSDASYWLINGVPYMYVWNIVSNLLYLLCPIALSALSWFFISSWLGDSPEDNRYTNRVVGVVAILSALAVFGGAFWGYYFTVDPVTGVYTTGPYNVLTTVGPTIPIAFCMVRAARAKLPLPDRLLLISYPLVPYIATLLVVAGISPVLPCIYTLLSTVFIYTNLYVRRGRIMQAQQQELTNTQLNAMLLQINPHFIFNTLGSIDSLCAYDPASARKLIQQFSQYLQNNYTDMTRRPMISFQEEIGHLQNYLSIEQVRFPNMEVEYDLRATDFMIPSLSVQPLAENAIKHGITQRRRHQGTLTISSREGRRSWFVIVRDDGVGFDPEKAPSDSRAHLGIENVRARLELLCGGTLTIESTPGAGTTCRIRIPKEVK